MIPEGCELVELPNGTRCFYKDADHSYWRCKADGTRGTRLTGVSTVSAPLDFRPDPLLRWASRLTLEGVVRAFAGQEVPSDPFVLSARLADLNLDWESIRDEAGAGGTNIHAQVLHALATGGEVPNLDDLPPEQRGKGQAVMKWWLDHDPTVLQAEQVVLCEEHGFAGRFDLRCEIQGVIHMVDLKTGGFIPTKAHAQVAGYDLGAIESGFGPSTCLVIVQVAEDGTYRQIPVHATHEDFLAAVRVYRAAGRIGGAAKRDRVAA